MKYIKFILLLLLISSHANAENSNSAVSEGRKLHLSIISSHKKIDSFYKEADLFGALTPHPKVTIYLPISAWNKLNKIDQNKLSSYAASLVEDAKRNPLKYSKIPSNAPASTKVRNNARNMSKSSWQIIAGKISENGQDILADTVISAGK